MRSSHFDSCNPLYWVVSMHPFPTRATTHCHRSNQRHPHSIKYRFCYTKCNLLATLDMCERVCSTQHTMHPRAVPTHWCRATVRSNSNLVHCPNLPPAGGWNRVDCPGRCSKSPSTATRNPTWQRLHWGYFSQRRFRVRGRGCATRCDGARRRNIPSPIWHPQQYRQCYPRMK